MDIPTLLIADDEPANLAVLTEILQPYFRIRAANSGARALRIAQSAPSPDLILLDVMMPEMDGYEVLTQLRRNETTQDMPVIFVTALSDEIDEERGFQLGAVDYITKPVKHATVLARVRVHLELKEARDQLRKQNNWLEREMERRLHEIHLIQDVSLCAMAQLAETRDNETGHHIQRTQAFVEVLARRLQREGPHQTLLSDAQVALITKAAPLHDIGKVGIPDSILLKPGPLTATEFEIMKTHARIGGDAIGNALEKALMVHRNDGDKLANGSLAFLETAQLIATSHHERWDGTGYPDGLAGADIPLAARIMAVADVFDALASRRVYKPAMSMEQSVRTIVESRGSQFDPDVVDAFICQQSDLIDIFKRFGDAVPVG